MGKYITSEDDIFFQLNDYLIIILWDVKQEI